MVIFLLLHPASSSSVRKRITTKITSNGNGVVDVNENSDFEIDVKSNGKDKFTLKQHSVAMVKGEME